LILGEGDGRFLARLLEINATAEVHVIDLSFEMLRIARTRAGAPSRARFVQASALALPLREQIYDAIVTNFFLDCLSPAQAASLIPRSPIRSRRRPMVNHRISLAGRRMAPAPRTALDLGHVSLLSTRHSAPGPQNPTYGPLLTNADSSGLPSITGALDHLSELWRIV